MNLTVKQALLNAIEAHKSGKLHVAERLYRAILKNQPKQPDANHNLGVIIAAANPQEALPYLKTALKTDAKQRRFWLSYINALIDAKRYPEARQVLEEGKSSGLSGDAVSQLEEKLGEAQTQTASSQSKVPSQKDIDDLLSYYKVRDAISAEKLAKSMCHDFPDYHFGWKVLGAVLSDSGRAEDAVEPLRQSIRLNGQDTEAHNYLGTAFRGMRRFTEAEASYREAIRLKPDSSEAHNNLGIALGELQRLTEADASYREAIRLKPNFPEAHNNLGVALRDLRRFMDAEASYREAIRLKPDFPEAHNNLGTALQQQGKLGSGPIKCLRAA